VDFSFSEEQVALRERVLAFATAELNDDLLRRDRDREFSAEAWARCARLGLQAMPVPGELGGGGCGAVTMAVALEALGQGCRDNGLAFGLGAHLWSCVMPLVTFGTADQKRRYLPGLGDGSLVGVQAMSEPGSGSDAFAMATTATPDGDGYRLEGRKTFVTNGPVADVFVVFAATDPSRGFAGASAFVLERATPGLEVGEPLEKMGLRTTPMSELALNDCRVGPEALLGRVGAGMAVFTHSMDWERSLILAPAVGAMARQLERCTARARERRQFGRPIGKFQAVAHRIVDMRLRLETSRLLLYKVAWSRDAGHATDAESALAKLHISQAFLDSSLDALSIFGGYGYLADYELERDVRDAVAGRIYSGTSDIQRNIVAGRMRL